MRHKILMPIFAGLMMLTAITLSGVKADAQEKAVGEILRNIVESNVPTIGLEGNDERFVPIFLLYEERHYTPIWVRDSGPKFKAKHFLEYLRKASEDALNPSDYRIPEIEKRIKSTDYQDLAELELLLSRALLDYGRDLHAGRVEPSKVNSDVHIFPEAQAANQLLDQVAYADKVAHVVDKLAPQTPRYSRMKQMLKAYKAMAAKGGWIKVPAGETLKPKMISDRVPAIRTLMGQTGDLKDKTLAEGQDPNLFGPKLVAAVKNFQHRHGIDQDGVIGPSTLAEMRIPIETRVRQIELNMERRRWMQDKFGDLYIFVNLADQFLKVVREIDGREKTVHTAPLVVGKPYHQTPVFSKPMTYMVVNPFWNVPNSIATKELLPDLRRDPAKLIRQNIRIFRGWGKDAAEINPLSVDWSQVSAAGFPFRLRQDAGNRNALGRIKFMFPNKFSVYIHDTPSKSLFARTRRFFSHGCMRVQDPRKLAEVLTRVTGNGLSRARIDQMIADKKRRVIRFKRPIPVHVTYLTAWVNKDMTIHFRKDIYGRDKKLDRALKRARFATANR